MNNCFIKWIIDVNSRGEARQICSLFRWRLCSAGWRGDAHFVLWNACNTNCNWNLLEGPELFSERKFKNNRQIDLVLLTHFDDCFWPKISRKTDLTRFDLTSFRTYKHFLIPWNWCFIVNTSKNLKHWIEIRDWWRTFRLFV